MATSFQNIYDFFLPNIKDYTLARLFTENPNAYEAELRQILLAALPNMVLGYEKIASLDLVANEFTETLSPQEMAIFGKLMAIEYLTPFVIEEGLIRDTLISKDYRTLNKGRHSESLQKIKDELSQETNKSMSRVSYTPSSISQLFGGNN